MVPWRTFSITSLASAFVFSWSRPEFSRLLFTGTFIGFWVLQFFGWAVYVTLIWPYFLSPLRDLPEPKGGHWLHGQWHRIHEERSGGPQVDWINEIPNDGIIRYRGFFNQERLLTTTPETLAEVLVTRNYDFEKPASVRYSIARMLGVGVLVAEGDEHKLQRRKLMPAFSFRHIKDLYPTFWLKATEGVRAMVDQVHLDSGKAPASSADPEKAGETLPPDSAVMEIGQWASRTTLDIIGVAGMGHDFGAIRNPGNELMETYKVLFQPSSQARVLALVGLFLPSWIVSNLPVRRNDDIAAAAKKIRDVCQELIRSKKEKLAHKELLEPDILSVALDSGLFSDESLVDQLMTFLAAGHETTASAMTWAVYMLCRFPEIQTRLRNEIREHLPRVSESGPSNIVSSTEIDHMPYLNAVCSEVLRYFTPVPLTLRQAAVDTSIKGHFVPKGTTLIIAPGANNKSEALWGPGARQFNPDRWLPKFEGDKLAASGGTESNYAFMTFLHGPRSCIGSNFAKAEFACLLAAWIGTFEFELHDKEQADESKLEIKGGITARPAGGMWVRAKVVDGW